MREPCPDCRCLTSSAPDPCDECASRRRREAAKAQAMQKLDGRAGLSADREAIDGYSGPVVAGASAPTTTQEDTP
jgi:hypothetical protein